MSEAHACGTSGHWYSLPDLVGFLTILSTSKRARNQMSEMQQQRCNNSVLSPNASPEPIAQGSGRTGAQHCPQSQDSPSQSLRRQSICRRCYQAGRRNQTRALWCSWVGRRSGGGKTCRSARSSHRSKSKQIVRDNVATTTPRRARH